MLQYEEWREREREREKERETDSLQPVLDGVQLCHGYDRHHGNLPLVVLEDEYHVKVPHMKL